MPQKLQHDRLGECEFVRTEGVDWIIRCCDGGQIHRLSPSQRRDLTWIPASPETIDPTADSKNRGGSSSAEHRDGVGQLLRAIRSGNHPTGLSLLDGVKAPAPVPSQHRNAETQPKRFFISDEEGRPNVPPSPPLESEVTPTPARPVEVESLISPHPTVTEPCVISVTDGAQTSEKRRLRRVFESLRNGLSSVNAESRPFAVGIERIQQKVANLLTDVAVEGGRALVLRGAYGQGKTFSLQLLQQVALEEGFVVASTEINADETPLEKPHMVFRCLMRQLRFPDGEIDGVHGLALRTREKLRRLLPSCRSGVHFATEARRVLEMELQCRPLAWLLSDGELLDKQHLLDLLGCNAGVEVYPARRSHALQGQPHDWPSFSAGTQGDFGSYLLSGVARLTRFLGYRGLILVLDEMEKWQDLNWVAQCRAGNLLGGLIWSASAEMGRRRCCKMTRECDHSEHLKHSTRCGGFPFSTEERCFLGLAIAMTPRGDDGPEKLWSAYGLLEIADLPFFTPSLLESYVQKIFPSYCRAHDLHAAMPVELIVRSVRRWRQTGDGSTRTAVQAVMSTLDEWQESLTP